MSQENPKQVRLPNATEVSLVLIAFVGVIFLFLNVLQMPIQLALVAVWFVFIALGLRIGLSYDQMEKGLIKGINQGMQAVLIILIVGMLIGSWIAGGIVPSIVYYGLSIMSPNIFLFAAFFICMCTSLATGTSFGTAGTAGIAMMGIGQGFGIPLPLVAGVVISGAYVGDKMSPLSDTTIMTASLAKVDLIDHIKSMLYVSAPAVVISAILFLLVGFFYVGPSADVSRIDDVMVALQSHFVIGWHLLLPAFAVIGLLAMRMPAIPVIIFGALLGSLCAWLIQGMDPLQALYTCYGGNKMQSSTEFLNVLLNRGGLESMFSNCVLVLFALGIGGLMEVTGIMQTISNILLRWATNPGRLTLSTLVAAFFGNFFGAVAYVSLITGCTMTEKSYDKLGIDRRVLSRNIEAGGTVTTPMVPWADGGAFMAATLGVSTMAYLPFLWYNFLAIAISLFYGYANLFIWRVKPQDETATDTADTQSDAEVEAELLDQGTVPTA